MEWVKLNNFTPGTLIQKCTLLLKWKSHFRVNCQIKTHLDNDEQLWRGDVAEFSTGNSISWNTEWQHEVVFNTFMLVKHFKSHVFCYCERWCTACTHVCNSESRIKAFTTERHGSSIYLKTQKLNRSSSRVFALNHNPDSVWIDLKAWSNYLEKVKSIHYRLTCFCYWAQGEKGECNRAA